MPTQNTKSSVIYSWNKRRHAIPQEVLSFQGMPVFESFEAAAGVQLQFKHLLSNMPESGILRLVGNAVYLRLVGKQILYLLTRVRPTYTFANIPRWIDDGDLFMDCDV